MVFPSFARKIRKFAIPGSTSHPQLITNQAQDRAFPAWQTDGPITGQTKTRCDGCLRHRKALQDAIADPFFEAHHKMRTPIQQGGQKRKAEVPAIKNGGPVPGPLQGRRSFQIRYLAGRDHPLLRDPTGALQDRMHLGCPTLLSVLGPTVRQ
jgi:hypothetical protein